VGTVNPANVANRPTIGPFPTKTRRPCDCRKHWMASRRYTTPWMLAVFAGRSSCIILIIVVGGSHRGMSGNTVPTPPVSIAASATSLLPGTAAQRRGRRRSWIVVSGPHFFVSDMKLDACDTRHGAKRNMDLNILKIASKSRIQILA
jgi:hypothetical protein